MASIWIGISFRSSYATGANVPIAEKWVDPSKYPCNYQGDKEGVLF